MHSLRLWARALALALLFGAQPAWASPAATAIFTDIQTHTLPNGLKVILRENHAASVVALQMWVRVGSAQEEDPQAGMAHVLEHMLFKGTERRGIGEIARAVESRGGTLNAFTSYDHTVYHFEMASRDLALGLEVLSDAIQRSTLDAEELRKESEVILEEFQRSRDKPSREVYRRLFEQAFRVHPYRRPVIGYEETFKTFTRSELVAFYRRWYRPDNMFLVVVGDMDPKMVMELVERHFGSWRPEEGGALEKALPAEPPQESFRSTLFNHPAAKVHLSVGCHIPNASYPKVQALDAFAFILGQGQSSRLYQRVKEDEQLVHSVSSYAVTPREPGLFVTTAVLEPEKIEPALKSIMAETFRLALEGPSDDELAKAKLNIVSDFIYEQETMSGQAQSLGYFESLMGDVRAVETYVDKVRALSARDVAEEAAPYLNPANCTASVLLPEGSASGLSQERVETIVAEAKEAASQEAALLAAESDVSKTVLSNGLTVLVKENHAVPTVAIRAVMSGGVRYETPESNGISSLTASLLTHGSSHHTAAEMARSVESMAGSLRGFSGRNSLGLEAQFLSEDWERGLELLAEALLSPTFEPGEIEKKKTDALAAIAQRRDDLFNETLMLFSRSLYGSHPYAMDPLGTEASVASISREGIVEFYGRTLKPAQMVVAVVGDVEAEAVRGAVERLFGSVEGKPSAALQLPTVGSPKKVEKAVSEINKRQAHLLLGFPGVTLDSPDRYPLEVIEGVLAGQAGRLFVELRDKRSLSYALTAFARANLDPGLIAIYVGTSPDKEDDVVAGIIKELERLVEEPVGAEELEAAKRAIIGTYELRHQTNSAQAESLALMELYGLGYKAVREYPKHIEAVTQEDLKRVARRYLTLDRYVLAVVRPPRGMDGSSTSEESQGRAGAGKASAKGASP